MLEYTRDEAKAWAKKNYRGLESCIYPSFTADMKNLDEEAIRHDVRLEIAQGFFSIAIVPGACGMTMEERFRFAEIVNDEAKGKILVSTYVEHDTFEDGVAILNHHARTGGNHALLGFTQNLYPKTPDEACRVLEKLCNSTDLAIDIYPTGKFNLARFHPQAAFDPAWLERLSDIPNVVGMKIGHGPISIAGFTDECYRRCGDKIMVNHPDLTWWPVSIQKYGAMWSGCCSWHAFQTPDKPRAVQCYELFLRGEIDKAYELWWQLVPIWQSFGDSFPLSMGGIYHYTFWKYTQWLVGGNGGLMRMPGHRLYDHEAEKVKAIMKTWGVNVSDEPFEAFLVGRQNWNKGIRFTI